MTEYSQTRLRKQFNYQKEHLKEKANLCICANLIS